MTEPKTTVIPNINNSQIQTFDLGQELKIKKLIQTSQFLAILLLLLSTAFGYNIYQTKFQNKNTNGNSSLTSNNPTLDQKFKQSELEVQNLIQKSYLRDTPTQELYNEYKLKGIIASLQDPYSEYLSKKNQDDLQSDLNQRFVGIGIKLEKIEDRFVVTGLIKKSPAVEAGIEGGDVLVKVDDFVVINSSLDELVTKIRGTSGTPVKIEIARKDQIKDFVITRREVKNDLITLDFKKQYAIITISSFGDSLAQEMQKISKQIIENPAVESIIIDVRTNTGGLLDQSVDLMSYFVPQNTVLVQEKSKDINGKEAITQTKSIPTENNLIKYPVIVLTNKLTASASEILTGVMKEKRNAKTIGQKTFGKGVVQQIFPTADGNAVKLTIAEWLTPNGQNIDKKGIEPDIKIKDTEDALEIALNQ